MIVINSLTLFQDNPQSIVRYLTLEIALLKRYNSLYARMPKRYQRQRREKKKKNRHNSDHAAVCLIKVNEGVKEQETKMKTNIR